MSLPTLRVFISSPGDVDTERKIAARVIERLAAELCGRLGLDAYFWEDEPMVHHRTFQEQIPPTSEFDLVLCILWSRLGTPLKGPDGREYPSGTDYEVESARAAYERTGKPELMIYLNQTPAQLRQLPREERERMVRQLEALEGFVERHCVQSGSGVIKGAFTTYRDLGQFEDLLEKHLRKLVAARLPAGDAPGTLARSAEITWRGRPYQGLRAFDFEQAPIFFGRTRAVGEVLALLRQRAVRLEEARAAAIGGLGEGIDPAAAIFVLVCAMSGVGKSSLVRAGVLPLLVQPGGGVGLWRRVVLKPSETPAGGDLFDALAQALTRAEGLPELLSGGVSLPELAFMLRRNPAGIELLLKQALSQAAECARAAEAVCLAEEARRCREAGRLHDVERLEAQRAALGAPPARLAVAIDQLEELFTLESISPELRRGFAQALAALARSGWAWVIGTLRSDFFGRCAEVPELMALKAQGLYDLQPPSPEELGQMIRRPAQAAGLAFERHPATDLALDESLRDVAVRSPEALPLLEFALDQLYERRTVPGGRLTWAAYQEIGGLEGALASAAEEALGELRSWQQETFDHVMGGLVSLGTGAREEAAHRRTADYEALTRPAGAKAFVDGFIAARLFVADRDTAGRAIVSVAHEALLARQARPRTGESAAGAAAPEATGSARRPWQWARLGAWVEANADFLRMRARVAAGLKQWQEAEEDMSFLLPTGRALLDGEVLLRDYPQALSTEEQTYIKRSTAAEVGRRRRLARVRTAVMAGMATLALGAGIGAWFGFSGKYEALNQTKRVQTQLHEASVSDWATGRDLFDKNAWAQGMAYLAGSLRYDPGNQLTKSWFWNEVVYGQAGRDPLPRLLLKPDRKPNFAHFCLGGAQVIFVSDDHTVKIWHLATQTVTTIPIQANEESSVGSAEISPNERWVTLFLPDDGGNQWPEVRNSATGKLLGHEENLYSAEYSPDGKRIVTAGSEHIQLWNATDGNLIGQLAEGKSSNNGSPSKASSYHAKFSPDGTRVLAISDDGSIGLWTASTGQACGNLSSHGARAQIALFTPEGTRILTIEDNILRCWNSVSCALLVSSPPQGRAINFAAISPDGTRIVTTDEGNDAILWDVVKLTPIGNAMHYYERIVSAEFSADSTKLLIGASDYDKLSAIDLWSATDGERIGGLHTAPNAKFTPDGSYIVGPGSDNQGLQLIDVSTLESAVLPICKSSQVNNFDLSPDSSQVLTAEEGVICVWDLSEGISRGEPMGSHSDAILSAAFSPDGKHLATVGRDRTARVWEVSSGKMIGQPMLHAGSVRDVSFSPDGNSIVTNSDDDRATIWNVFTGQRQGFPTWHEGTLHTVLFSPDGKRILTVADTAAETGVAQQWDAADGHRIGEPIVQLGLKNAAFSPNGNQIVTVYDNENVQIWDAANSKPIGGPIRNGSPVYTAAFSPDSTQIITGGYSNAKVWSTLNGKLLLNPLRTSEDDSNPVGAFFDLEGRKIITFTSHGAGMTTTQLWNAINGTALCEPIDDPQQSLEQAQHEIRPGVITKRLWESIGGTRTKKFLPNGLGTWSPTQSSDVFFSTDGTKIATVTNTFENGRPDSQHHATVWELDSEMPLPPVWIERFSQAVSGYRLAEDGQLHHLSLFERVTLRDSLLGECVSPGKSMDSWANLCRWALLPVANRQVVPGSVTSTESLADRLLDSNDEINAKYLLRLWPNHPLVHLALAAFERDAARAYFLRSYDLERLPNNSKLLSRAAAMLRVQKKPRLAFQTLEKTLKVAPPNAELLASLALTRWLIDDKDGAVRDSQRLLALDPTFADPAKPWAGSLPEADATALTAALAETLRQHPELAPQPAAPR